MNNESVHPGSYYTELARVVGKCQGLTQFLIEVPDNLMTKEDIVKQLAEFLKEFKANTTKKL
jgi:hypothetical protein